MPLAGSWYADGSMEPSGSVSTGWHWIGPVVVSRNGPSGEGPLATVRQYRVGPTFTAEYRYQVEPMEKTDGAQYSALTQRSSEVFTAHEAGRTRESLLL